jgi:hypothetical protein
MKYSALVAFEPIESVIQLNWADEVDHARDLVSSYVISNEMAERLSNVIFPQLRFDQPADNKGLLVVGNYGTGKSHLLAVISAIAERADLAGALTSQAVADRAAPIAGRFQVARTEIGATRMALREIITAVLEGRLAELGIDYQFPTLDEVSSSKPAFETMMRRFGERFPDQGLLLVLDELLEYLKTRDDHELILDLTFLRELGEICENLRFRFIAGVQEAIFDSTRFAFVASSLNRVRERFEQVHIARRDVKFVVAERLLRKRADQQAQIRAHLQPFARFYSDLTERLDEFVRLFPVHPDYIEMFEEITSVEKREILKTLSAAMKRRYDQDVPSDRPGLIAYDDYWTVLSETPSYRAMPEIRDVIDCSRVVEERVNQAMTRRQYQPLARRIIHGLSVHRLSVGGIDQPLGATPEELRDRLCLFDPLVRDLGGDEPAEDLLTHIQTVLREIHRTVSGQFLTENPDNRQWYLDLKKTEDYDALIDQRAETLDGIELDRAYFEALKVALEATDQPYVTGYRIWEHPIEWRERKAEREGYLFFGAPNERSTAQPPRDFYLYFLPVYEAAAFNDEKKPDELFFRLTGADAPFSQHLRRYAAATALALLASGQKKTIYDGKARGELSEVTKWLRANVRSAFAIAYQGTIKTVAEWLTGTGLATVGASVRDLVNGVGSVCLAAHFADLAPEYPAFDVLITAKNRAQAAQDALRWIRGVTRTHQGAAVLDALELLDGDKLTTTRSRYATYVLSRLKSKGNGQVLNRAEIVERVADVDYVAPQRFRIEPEWLIVVLGALVASGEVVLALPGKTFDATATDAMTATPLADLLAFKHLAPPRDFNLPALKALFELLSLPSGNAQAVATGSAEAVQQLQAKVTEQVAAVAQRQGEVVSGFPFWSAPVMGESERQAGQARLGQLKAFLEALQPYNTPGKLKNLKYGVAEIEGQKTNLATLKDLTTLGELVASLGPAAAYLSEGSKVLPGDHPWQQRVDDLRKSVRTAIESPTERNAPTFRAQTSPKLVALQKEYLRAYLDLHQRARLGLADDQRRANLLKDERLKRLRRLSTIELLAAGSLTSLEDRVKGLRLCYELIESELQTATICPHCQFNPTTESVPVSAATALNNLDDEIDKLLSDWTTTLLDNLEDPTVAETLSLLSPTRRALIQSFLQARALPNDLTGEFISAVQEALAGLKKLVLKADEIKAALQNGGSPQTPKELRQRFEQLLTERLQGQEQAKVRIVVE